jgi:hypothetical protein
MMMQPITAEMRRTNELHAQRYWDEYETAVANYKRDNPWNYKGDPDNPIELENYRRQYEEKLNSYSDSLFNQGKKNNSSKHYRDLLETGRVKAIESNRRFSLETEDKWRMEFEWERFNKNIDGYLETMEPQRAYEAFENAFALYRETKEVTPEQQAGVRNTYGKMLRERYSTQRFAQVYANNPGDLTAAMNAALADIEKTFEFMPGMEHNIYDEEGNITGKESRAWSYEGMKEAEEKLMHGRYFDIMSEKQAFMERMIIGGNLEGAINFAKAWGAELNKSYNPDNREYEFSNETLLDRMSNYFDWKTLEGYLSQGTAGKKRILLDVYKLEPFIQSQFKGADGSVIVARNEDGSPIFEKYGSMEEAFRGFLYWKREAFLHDNGGPDNALALLDWDMKEATWLEEYYKEVGTALQNIDKSLAADYGKFRDFQTYLDSKSDYYLQHVPAAQRRAYAERSVDFFNSIFFNGITDAETIRNMMKEYTGREISRLMTEYKVPSSSSADSEATRALQMKNYSDSVMSELGDSLIFKLYSPHKIVLGVEGDGRTPESTYVFRSEQQKQVLETLREEERGKAADILGIDKDRLLPGWMDSPNVRGDVLGKGTFTIETGEHAGTYFLDYDDKANYILRRIDGSEYKSQRRPRKTSERSADRNADHEFLLKEINDGKHPISGESIPNFPGGTGYRNLDNGAYASEILRQLDSPPSDLPLEVIRNRYPNWGDLPLDTRLRAWKEADQRGRGRP